MVNELFVSGQNSDLRNINSIQGSMIGYWKVNEGSGTTLYDLVNNAGNATLVNGVLWEPSSFVESDLAQFDDVDDFNGYTDSNINLYPNYTTTIQVNYVDLAGKFRVIKSSPTDYKRVVVHVDHPGTTTLSDTLIVSPGL